MFGMEPAPCDDETPASASLGVETLGFLCFWGLAVGSWPTPPPVKIYCQLLFIIIPKYPSIYLPGRNKSLTSPGMENEEEGFAEASIAAASWQPNICTNLHHSIHISSLTLIICWCIWLWVTITWWAGVRIWRFRQSLVVGYPCRRILRFLQRWLFLFRGWGVAPAWVWHLWLVWFPFDCVKIGGRLVRFRFD